MSEQNPNQNPIIITDSNVNISNDEHHHHHQAQQPDRTNCNAEEIKSKIQQNIKKKLEEFQDQPIATDVIDVNQSLKPVQLQISKNIRLPKYDKLNTTTRMYNVPGLYKTQRVSESEVFNLEERNVEIEEIFILCKESANQDYKNAQANSKLTKEEYLELHGNRISVTGEAGIGKTTFTKMLVQKLLQDNTVLPNTEFVFYIQFRYLDYDKKSKLIEFLLTSCQCDWEWGKLDSNTLKALTDSIIASKCCFIFDGLDEAKIDLISEPLFCSLYSENSAENFIKNILSGKIFPKAPKLFTSRTLQLFELHPKCRPPFILQILGFGKDAQVDMCKQICGEERYVKAFAHLEQEISLLNLCHVPVNCILIMHTVNQRMQETTGERVNLTTMTDVMVSSLRNYLQSEHMRDKVEVLTKLAHLAFNGTTSAKSIFTKEDLTDVGITSSMLDSFLGSCVFEGTNLKVKILERSKCSFFSHLTWQEFFCAIHVFYFIPTDEFHFFVTRLEESRFDKVGKFMWGFCNMATQNQLEIVFGKIKDLKLKHDLLLNSACRNISILEGDGDFMDPVSIQKILQCFSLIREASLESLTKQLVNKLPKNLIFNRTLLSPSDISPLAYALQFVTKPLKLNLKPLFATGCLDRFIREVLKVIGQANPNIKILNLDLLRQKLSLEHIDIICSCFSKIENIDLKNCGVGYQGCYKLWAAREQNKNVIIKGVEGLDEKHDDCEVDEDSEKEETMVLYTTKRRKLL